MRCAMKSFFLFLFLSCSAVLAAHAAGDADPLYRIRYIVVKERPLAESLIRQIKNGADFSRLAQEHTLDKNAAKKGGRLGWSDLSDIDARFADGVRALPKDGHSASPVNTPFGWAVIWVDGIRYPGQAKPGLPAAEYQAHLAGIEKFYRYDCPQVSVPLLLNSKAEVAAFEAVLGRWKACYYAAGARFADVKERNRMGDLEPEALEDMSDEQRKTLFARRTSVMQETAKKADIDGPRMEEEVGKLQARMRERAAAK